MNAKLENSFPIWSDPEDAPEITDDSIAEADLYDGKTLVRRGRPVSQNPKVSTTIRLDAVILEAFKATGKGWQTRMNAVLKEWLAAQ